MNTHERMAALESNPRITRINLLQVGHFVLNVDTFSQPQIEEEAVIGQDVVSRMVTGLTDAGLVVKTGDQTRKPGSTGRWAAVFAAQKDGLNDLLGEYNELHMSYLSTRLERSPSSLRMLGATMLSAMYTGRSATNLDELSDTLELRPVTLEHRSIFAIAGAAAITEAQLLKGTPVRS